MSRSIKKGPYINDKLLEKVQKSKPGDKPIKTWCRACTISPEMVGYSFAVHNGKLFITVKVVENMVGHKLGEFSPTRKFISHGGKLAKGQEEESSATAAPKTPAPQAPKK
ncbi:MAG: hypothetical protein ACD_76C00094G0012 [uncultured bacterium]|nr:MAG: hypothetical protein ACD_76C00094G0012 [uncultured bacterium]HBD05267.1 30S ribosomal protein S19 [Candidatus Uhrbacteria bacterium]